MMKNNYFFRISWIIQLAVGIGLFFVSFYIETQILETFLAVPVLAVLLALALEMGKALAIIWHRYMQTQSGTAYPIFTRFISAIFRLGLVVLSLLCSVLYLANHLDRPQLDDVRSAELQKLEKNLDQALKQIDGDKALQLASLETRQKQTIELLNHRFGQRQQVLQVELTAEMNNVVNGVFKGQRYTEFERLLAQLESQWQSELERVTNQHFSEQERLNHRLNDESMQAKNSVVALSKNQQQGVLMNDFASDERVNDATIVSFLKVYEAVFDVTFEPLQFVFVFSLMLSLLMEIGIVLAFDTVTILLLPEFKRQQVQKATMDQFKADLKNQTLRDEIKHESMLDKVAKRADFTVKKAEQMVEQFAQRSS